MVCEKLFQTIDEISDFYFDVWEDVCNIESPTNCKEGVDKVGAYFIKMAKERGWTVEVFEQSVSGNVICITMNPGADKKAVSLSGHLDTVIPLAFSVHRQYDGITKIFTALAF